MAKSLWVKSSFSSSFSPPLWFYFLYAFNVLHCSWVEPMFATQITIVLLHFHTPHLNPMFFGQFHILFLVTSKFPGKIEMCGGQTLIYSWILKDRSLFLMVRSPIFLVKPCETFMFHHCFHMSPFKKKMRQLRQPLHLVAGFHDWRAPGWASCVQNCARMEAWRAGDYH